MSGAAATRLAEVMPSRERSCLDLRHNARQIAEHHADAPGHEIVHGGAGAPIRHVGHLDAGHALEQLAAQMRRRADAGRRERDAALLALA
jgi:hypothetical protein